MLQSTPRLPLEETNYELVFRLDDAQNSAFAFDCDEQGNVYRSRLTGIERHTLELCLQGEVDGYSVRPGIVRHYTHSYIESGGEHSYSRTGQLPTGDSGLEDG